MGSQKPIKVSQEHLNDMLWMSYRYCIGRHTIASHMHADTVVSYAKQLSDKQQNFMAYDIRRCVTDGIRFLSKIKVDYLDNPDALDAVTIMLKHMHDNNIKCNSEFWAANTVHIDTRLGTVTISKNKNPEETHETKYTIINNINDLLVWCKAANFLDSTTWVEKTYGKPDSDSEEHAPKTGMCFYWYGIETDGTVVEYWNTVDYNGTFTQNWHIAPEYILS